jgi:hypothetical protein
MARHGLSIPDIVSLVFDQVGDDKPTLARSARCCRAFHNPCLDRLWKNLPSVFPLAFLLRSIHDGTIVSSVKSFRTVIITISYRNQVMRRDGRDSTGMRIEFRLGCMIHSSQYTVSA